MFSFRLAQPSDIESILTIIVECQALLHSRGVDQWQDGYPNREAIIEDVKQQRGYMLLADEAIAAYGVLIYGVEEAYLGLQNGEWLTGNDSRYVTLHRMAVSSAFRGRGIGAEFFGYMEREAIERKLDSLRVDTHRDNHVMRRLICRSGFTLCGDVYYGASHRLGFEKPLQY